jgi:ribosomal-protein-alanine N-acetyltransferase
MKTMLAITPMCEAELDEVALIERISFGERWSVNSFKSELANPSSIYYVARWSGRVVGYIGYWLILDEAHVTAAWEPSWSCGRSTTAWNVAPSG